MAWRCPGVAHGNRLIVSQSTRGLASELPLTATSDGVPSDCVEAMKLPVVTATGYSYRRDDGVLVVPLTALGP